MPDMTTPTNHIDAPGLAMIFFGQGFNTLAMITRTDVTYFLGLFSTLLAIAYYTLKMYKEWKSK